MKTKTVNYQQERVGDYITTSTGKRFYINDPRAEDFCVEDIAHALSNLCRFTGHSPRFYSVGEHSLHCLDVARMMNATPLQCLYALLHDASEAVMNDLARPVKQNVPDYKALEDIISEVMWEVCGIPKPTEEDYKFVKKVDNTLIIMEMEQIMKRDDYEEGDSLESFINEIPFSINMEDGFGSGESKEIFLDECYHLLVRYKQTVNEVGFNSKELEEASEVFADED